MLLLNCRQVTISLVKNLILLVYPSTRCKLKLLKLERIKDYLLLEEEFVQNQELLKPQEEKTQVWFFERR